MTGPSERDEIAAVIVAHDPDQMECHDHLGRCCPSEGCAHGFKHSAEHQADAILASDLLAERDRRTAAKTLREYRDALAANESADYWNCRQDFLDDIAEWANEIEADR